MQVRVAQRRGKLFAIEVRNYGTLAVLDVVFDSAEYRCAPGSTAVPHTYSGPCPVLDMDRQPYTLWVDFVDEAGNTVLPGEFDDTHQEYHGDIRPNPDDVIARICFRDAEGTRWRRGNAGSAERLPR